MLVFPYIGGFSGAGVMLNDRKLDPRADYNRVFADPALVRQRQS
jgi:hypothetical protein